MWERTLLFDCFTMDKSIVVQMQNTVNLSRWSLCIAYNHIWHGTIRLVNHCHKEITPFVIQCADIISPFGSMQKFPKKSLCIIASSSPSFVLKLAMLFSRILFLDTHIWFPGLVKYGNRIWWCACQRRDRSTRVQETKVVLTLGGLLRVQ